MKAIIALTRIYEIELDKCPGDDITEKLYSAKQLAYDYFAEEMPEFTQTPKDFASANIINENEILNYYENK